MNGSLSKRTVVTPLYILTEMCKGILTLTHELEQNYHALQYLLRGEVPFKRYRSSGGASGKARNKTKLGFLKKQNFTCPDCGFIFKPDRDGKYPTATLDHVIPYRYGSTIMMNSEYVCGPCNLNRDVKFTLDHVIRFFGSIE